jgi:hypothetical protein
MAGIFFSKFFSKEYVPQVSLAVGTNNFRPHSVCIHFPDNGTFNLIIEAGPSAVAVKLIL